VVTVYTSATRGAGISVCAADGTGMKVSAAKANNVAAIILNRFI